MLSEEMLEKLMEGSGEDLEARLSELVQKLIERLAEIENFAGIKWSSPNAQQYMSMIRLFGERVSFISNGSVMSIGYKLGARGFTDFMVNVAPRLSLHRWQLVQEQRWDEFDRIELAMQVDPQINAVRPGELSGPGMGEGPDARLRLRVLGLDTGPHFPAQIGYTQEHIEAYRRVVDASGIREWVDWDGSAFE